MIVPGGGALSNGYQPSSVVDTFRPATVTSSTPTGTAPVISSLGASPAALSAPGATTLSWAVSGATSLNLSPRPGAVSGTITDSSCTTPVVGADVRVWDNTGGPAQGVGIRKMVVDAQGRLWYMGSENGHLGMVR